MCSSKAKLLSHGERSKKGRQECWTLCRLETWRKGCRTGWSWAPAGQGPNPAHGTPGSLGPVGWGSGATRPSPLPSPVQVQVLHIQTLSGCEHVCQRMWGPFMWLGHTSSTTEAWCCHPRQESGWRDGQVCFRYWGRAALLGSSAPPHPLTATSPGSLQQKYGPPKWGQEAGDGQGRK